jgi:hypothetical protein
MAHVTIPATDPYILYTASGGQTVFVIPFPFFATADIVVAVNDVVLGGGFTVTGTSVDGGFSSGTVTFTVGRTVNDRVAIYRRTPLRRTTDFPYPSTTLNIQSLNTDLDRIVALQQEAGQDYARALRVPDSDPVPTELPAAAARAGKLLTFDSSGNPAMSTLTLGGTVTVSGYAAQLLDDPDAATARGTLGATTVGDALFIAASQATARTALGLGTAATQASTAFAASGAVTGSALTMATARLLGRTTASTGAVEEITVGAGLALNAGALAATTGIDRQVFNASATWTKPAGFPSTALVLLEAWGGGGSGRRDSGGITNASGGGGGGYAYRWLTLADLGPTETITIGAGGAARSGSNQSGAAGGNTTIGSLIDAFGGGGGGLAAAFGGGGGMAGAGTTGAVGSVHSTVYGGGSGGYDNSGTPVAAAPSGWGGGGGGGGASGAAGGISRFGGAGGAAGATATGVAGTQPGGGGGGATGTSGAGADGRAIITVFR